MANVDEEKSVKKCEIEIDHLDTLVNDGKNEKEIVFSEAEMSKKSPISSAETFKKPEESKDSCEQLEECSEDIKTSSDGQSFEVFNETECIKFAEKFHKIVQELRINRISERENELRIQKLMSEKSDLERLKDDEVLKNNELIQNQNMKQEEARKQFEEKLHSFQEDKTKHMLEKQSGEKEIKALKDEIRALHITKYNMEKLIKDQERQIQSQGTTNTNYITQLAKLEKQCKDAFKQCSNIFTAVDKVEANVNASAKLHKKLSFMNGHQNCILETYKRRLEDKKQDLINLEARQVSSTSAENNTKESLSLVHLEDELRMQKELCQQVMVQLNDNRQENQELLKSLNNAHELLEKHVESNNKYAETDALTQLELDELRSDCEKLREELKTERNCVEEKDDQLKKEKINQAEKEKELCEEIEKLRNGKDLLGKEKVSLEELNSTWSQKHVEQHEEIEKLKKTLNELERLVEETKKESGVQSAEVARLEDSLKNEVTRYEDLLKKAQEENSQKTNETTEWKERAAKFLENEEKMKIELEKMKSENESKQPQNQETQTKVIETQEKETNTSLDGLLGQTITSTKDKGVQSNETQPLLNDANNSAHEKPTSKNISQKVQEILTDNQTQAKTHDMNTLETTIAEKEAPNMRQGGEVQMQTLQEDITSIKKHTHEQTETAQKNTSFGSSETQIRAENNLQEKSTSEQKWPDNQQSPGKIPGTNPLSAKDKSSVGSSLLYSTKEKPLPVQHTAFTKSTLLQKPDEIDLEKNVSPGNNSSASKTKSFLRVKGIQRETIPQCKTTDKQKPVLAVETAGSRPLCKENTDTASPSVVSRHLHQGNSDATKPNSVNGLLCKVVYPRSIQPENQNKSLVSLDDLSIASEAKKARLVTSDTTDVKPADDSKPLTISDKPRESNSSIAKAQNTQDLMDTTATKNDGKARGSAEVEDFCFSDEEQESMPRAIGSQIDRIEAFLKNDRLRLFKKRKAPDE